MTTKTLAALLVAPRKIELREFPLPEIDSESGLAKIEITGVCGADWPIYTGALEHWRHYEPWLAPLKAALGQLADAYPAVPALD